jgi:hypothetical protein
MPARRESFSSAAFVETHVDDHALALGQDAEHGSQVGARLGPSEVVVMAAQLDRLSAILLKSCVKRDMLRGQGGVDDLDHLLLAHAECIRQLLA